MKQKIIERISARQLLEGVYSSLKNKLGGREIHLPSKAMVEIANDSDWHRTRIGYSAYETALLLNVEGKEWAVAFGTNCGSYPAEPYNCDIAAVSVFPIGKSDEEIAKEVYKALKKGSYFRNSLIYTLADGQLAVSKNSKFGQKVLELLRPKIKEFIVQDLETDSRYLYLDLRPVVKCAIEYKPEFVSFLCDIFRSVLAA